MQIKQIKLLHKDFLKLESYDLCARKFSGAMSPVYNREIFSTRDTGEAAVVLPYDPIRDEVIIVEQFRLPAWIRLKGEGWILEPVAGLIAEGDSAEDSARRELEEETGLKAKRVEFIARYMPSPGAFTELFHLFIAEVDSSMRAATAGLESEHEDIRVHVMPVLDAIAMADSGQFNNANLILSLNWLARHRDALRRRWLTPIQG